MTRDEVFAFLESKGVNRLNAEFAGGGDEGGVEYISAWDKDKKPVETDDDKWAEVQYFIDDMLQDRPEICFDGDDATAGTVSLNVATKTISISGRQQEWVDFDTFFVE
jgi:hypothetical protein